MNDLEGKVGEVHRGVVNIAIFEWVHLDRSEGHCLVNGNHLDPMLSTPLQYWVEDVLVIEAHNADFAVDHVNRVKLESDDAPLLNLPVELIERFLSQQRADPPVK